MNIMILLVKDVSSPWSVRITAVVITAGCIDLLTLFVT